MLKKIFLPALLIMLIAATSCSSYQKMLKSGDHAEKYETAVTFYEDGDYYRALQLFEQVIPVYKATGKAEKIDYYRSYCYFNQKEYIMASYYFKKYTKSYPNSEKAEECMFMSAYCKYIDSPSSSLDQTSTFDAIREMQLFANMYPGSDRLEECNELIDKLRLKLETKDLGIGRLYYKMEDYRAAITAFNNVVKDYPNTGNKEEILYLIMKSYYKYANKSVPKKRKERYASAIEASDKLSDAFPDGRYSREALSIRENATKLIESL